MIDTQQSDAPGRVLHFAMLAEECAKKSIYWADNGSPDLAEYFTKQGQRYVDQALRIAKRFGL